MEHKAVIDRIRWALADKGMVVFDAFRAFNSSNSGLLTCSEMYGGLEFLAIPFTPEQVHDLVRKLANYTEGLISYVEFKSAFQMSEDEMESRMGGDSSSSSNMSNFESIPPKIIPELAEQLNAGAADMVFQVTESVLQNFNVKTKQVPSLSLVWDSQDTQSQSQVSVWAPTSIRSLITKNKVRVCLGHYASKGLKNPLTGHDTKKFLTIEVTDIATIRFRREKAVNAVLNRVLPHPLRFKQVWHLGRGQKTMYAWKAVAPENFVAVGMICTATDDPPNVQCMRCLPTTWLVPTAVVPTKIWDDTGAGGGKPGSMWTVNSMDMVVVVHGHEAPKEPFFEFKSHNFTLEGMLNYNADNI